MRSTSGGEKRTEVVRLRASYSEVVDETFEKLPPARSRNVLMLIGSREFIAHLESWFEGL